MTLLYDNMSRDDLLWKVSNLKEANRRLRDTIACKSWMPMSRFNARYHDSDLVIYINDGRQGYAFYDNITGNFTMGGKTVNRYYVEAFIEIPKFER